MAQEGNSRLIQGERDTVGKRRMEKVILRGLIIVLHPCELSYGYAVTDEDNAFGEERVEWL